MSTYKIQMTVTAYVEMEVEATSETSVRTLIDKKLIMTAGLVEADSVSFDVVEDYIADMEIIDVQKL